MLTRGTLVLVMMAAALLAGCKQEPVAGMSGTAPVAVVRHIKGDDLAGQKGADVLLITSAAQLDALKSKTLSGEKIDFASQSLVVLALGEKPTAGFWARITGVQSRGADLYVQGVVSSPAKDATVAQVVSYPFDAVVIAKAAAKAVHPEVQSAVGLDPAAIDTVMFPAPAPAGKPAAK